MLELHARGLLEELSSLGISVYVYVVYMFITVFTSNSPLIHILSQIYPISVRCV
jgi:hypothetical protein